MFFTEISPQSRFVIQNRKFSNFVIQFGKWKIGHYVYDQGCYLPIVSEEILDKNPNCNFKNRTVDGWWLNGGEITCLTEFPRL